LDMLLKFGKNCLLAILTFWFCHVIGLSTGWKFLVTLMIIAPLSFNVFPKPLHVTIFLIGIWAAAVSFVNAPNVTQIQRQISEMSSQPKGSSALDRAGALAAAIPNALPGANTTVQSAAASISKTQAQTTIESMKALEQLCSTKALSEAACAQARTKLLQ
jgi:hypothetical protein